MKVQNSSVIADQTVGQALRQIREGLGMSARALATQTGFSPSFISQVETGQASPSISSLQKIAAALGLTLGQFFNVLEPNTAAVTRSSERKHIASGWSKARIESLGRCGPAAIMDAILVTLDPGGSSGKHESPQLQETFVYVREGEVLLTLNGEDFTLQDGDTIAVPRGVPICFQNTSEAPASILIVSAAAKR